MIYTKYRSPRLNYVLNFIFGEVFGASYRVTDLPAALENHSGCRIAYSDEETGGAFRIPPSGLLSGTGIRSVDPGIGTLNGLKVLFASPGSADLDYDIFSAVFYMISRYEEYLPFREDRHGRFEAESSLAFREGFLEIPVVDLWLKDLREKIIARFPGQQMSVGRFTFIPTTDVDLPYAVLHHGTVRTLGGNLKALLAGPAERTGRRKVLRGEIPDPFDTFGDIERIHSKHNLKPTYFFLCAGYGKYDKSISPRSGAFGKLVRETAGHARLGIHPSYRSGRNQGTLAEEINMFEQITGERPLISRQHYLKFRFPETFRRLIGEGIAEDYSLGFASAAGFRAGTCRPFFFYDLERELQTGLRLYPFQLMDRTLKDYMGLTAERAYEKMRELADRVNNAGGVLVSIWHNETFSNRGEWEGWREVYIRMLDYIAGKS